MVSGAMANLVQVGPLFTMQPLMPNFQKLNVLAGLKKLFSMRSTVELLKGLFKIVILASIFVSIIQGNFQRFLALSQEDFILAWHFGAGILGQMAGWACAVYMVFGAADWFYQRYEYQKQMRMTRQEVRNEWKSMEGDPKIKQRIRAFGQKMVMKRQLAKVPLADVVVTNPTHFAVALQYDPDIAPAPRVVAKGQDHFALKIREVAKENNVPIIENKPLARSLYSAVEADDMIPAELYVAVAEVLAIVFKKNKSRKAPRPKSPLD
jgi:flagellar biosynthetic protein FlhB